MGEKIHRQWCVCLTCEGKRQRDARKEGYGQAVREVCAWLRLHGMAARCECCGTEACPESQTIDELAEALERGEHRPKGTP
jgi:hypothetical protein